MLIQAPIAPFLGAVQIPLIRLLKLAVSSVAPLSQLPTVSLTARRFNALLTDIVILVTNI